MGGEADDAYQFFHGHHLPANWTIHREDFSAFELILDFLHALCYSFAGRSVAEGQVVYRRWIQWVWQGWVASILLELEAWSAELGVLPPECPESDL